MGKEIKFRDIAVDERVSKLSHSSDLTDSEIEAIQTGGLDLKSADKLIENVYGIYSLPLGVAKNFLINGKNYDIPMSVEEPSIVAAASKAAKVFREAGGIHTLSDEPMGTGQLFIKLKNKNSAKLISQLVKDEEKEILEKTNSFIPNLVERGGGVKGLDVKIIGNEILVLDLFVDTRNAMGANIIDTLLEKVSPFIEDLTGSRIAMTTLTNLSKKRLARAEVAIPIEVLTPKLARRIVGAQRFAEVNVERAVTHNKGIFNGIDAVAVATGNDWRAIEAGGHAFACRDGTYKPLTSWQINGQHLIGNLMMPMQVGIVGGLTNIHPVVKTSLKIMDIHSSNELAEVFVALGLAQNFAALLALTSEGIQKGHMALHKRRLNFQK